ncbi:TIGR00180 family glycosyltransferase [Pseudomonas entomophila]|uniref:TIGR00180 family glycosyltransferase n=1 Tax=Pseudomonas entomophila TaxID=312306 RepID=UPI003EC00A54
MPLSSSRFADDALRNRLTVVLITHNRPAFLRRTLHYYRDYPASLLVLDSSSQVDATLQADFPHVEYLHLPQFAYTGLQDKLAYGVERIKTPFMTFAADDDFLLFDGMTQSVAFLQAHPDYGVCHGYGMMYVGRGTEVQYFRRDKRVQEDYGSDDPARRLVDFMGQFLPPFYAVTRTDLIQQWYRLLPAGTSFEWQEIGHTFYLLTNAKARVLPIPYAVREANVGGSEHNTNVLTVLTYQDEAACREREQFAEFLASLPTGLAPLTLEQAKQVVLEAFQAMADGLLTGRALQGCMIVRSHWLLPTPEPTRAFGEQQFLEMPYYTKPMFDLLAAFEHLIHSLPCGRLQLRELEPILVRQRQLMQVQANDDERTLRARLWQALTLSPFNRQVVERLLASLEAVEDAEAVSLRAWLARLEAVPSYDSQALLDALPSGRLLNWLERRVPSPAALERLRQRLAEADGGPSFGIVLLDLKNDPEGLQATFDSLMNGLCRRFKVVVLTAGEPPAQTQAGQTVHFVPVDARQPVARLNQAVAQLDTDWVVVADAGDRFTASGLLRASLELLGAEGVRAVAMDEVHVQADGRLTDVLRPGVNLDLLQGVPGLMARHWLLRRDLLLTMGGFDARWPQALEFDLLLRLIGAQGLAGLAHLAEPLLTCAAPTEEDEGQTRSVLAHALSQRGYDADVSSAAPGVHRIDYRHAQRPQVSILLHCHDNAVDVQRALLAVVQRTRYQQHEILIADNASQSTALREWLDALQAAGSRVRVVRSEQPVPSGALLERARQQARGEYLVVLSESVEVLNANWLEGLLNQALRPEVGAVGGLLLDTQGKVREAGLVLPEPSSLQAAFVGASRKESGYLRRLSVEHDVFAVSGCLMVRAEAVQAVGGFDTQLTSVRAVQIELCPRLAAAGLLVVWTPQVQAIDHDDATGGLSSPWAEVHLASIPHDPFHNANHGTGPTLFTVDPLAGVDWQALGG